MPPASSRERTAIFAILGLALVARIWALTSGVPYAVGIDEPAIVDRALRILQTGNWNTQPYDYPSLVIYVHALVAIGRFLVGATRGEWASLAAYDVAAVYAILRLVTAVAGTATVWLVWRIGRDIHSSAVGLMAAAQLAIVSLHVRESHFILTDVPVTALATFCLWLTVRASRTGTAGRYGLAGAAAGLTAAAKYNGGVVIVAPLLGWVLNDRRTTGAGRKLAAILVGAAIAFVLGAPYAILDLPGFLDGFAVQMSRFARVRDYGEPLWQLYLKHLAHQGPLWIPAAVAGAVAVMFRPGLRKWWAPVLAFAAAYFYVLSTHSPVFARYALPIVPLFCLFAAVGIAELGGGAERVIRRPHVRESTMLVGTLVMTAWFAVGTVNWLDGLKVRDTRSIAAEWMVAHVDRGTRIAVENSGPTYLTSAGFDVVPINRAYDRPPSRYFESRISYIVISAPDLAQYGEFLSTGTLVFEIVPTPQRPGPPVRILKLAAAPPS